MKAVDGGACESLTLAIDDGRYPPLLREIHDPPALLYLRGDVAVLQQPQIAIVGSRNASSAGLRLAAELAAQLSAAGLCVCSGLALGIDGAAHRGALTAGGASVAVMATGIDTVYPRRHRTLAQTIVDQGCLVTEFDPGMPPLRENFPRRNRIISGLSLGVLVVEAAPGSGSLITARSALEQGREVFALPWSTLHPGGRGCLQLLRDGAKMVQGVDDVLEELGALYALQYRSGSEPAHGPGDADPPSPLLRFLGFEVMGVDQLVEDSGRPVSEVLAELAELELSGHVMRVAGGYVRR
ncbi:MAG: DNA-processing protein DprA [Halioglobus sp.]|nr:DNA-processing protein DprA [Halioglobus sp.]